MSPSDITTRTIATPRLKIALRELGTGVPVLFVHGNASSSVFWEDTMQTLPAGYRGIAPDLRGYGDTEPLRIDATRGTGDWVDDLVGLVETMGLDRFHVVGHSLGGVVSFGLVAAIPERLLSVTLVAPGSPWGFGGARGLEGTPIHGDGAGSGGGCVNPEFARLMGEKNRGDDDPQASPRVVMNNFYWKPPFRPAREEALLGSMLSEHVGPEQYPGDSVPSPNWPFVAPGRFGPVNALSPLYAGDTVDRFLAAQPKPPILWIRGDSDAIVADGSLFDLGTLGQMGLVPDWPGAEIHPPQPMVGQVRRVLERYAEAGGSFREHVIEDAGHTPYIEKPEAFSALFHPHLA